MLALRLEGKDCVGPTLEQHCMAKSRTLFDKIWDSHVVDVQEDGTCLLYIDRPLPAQRAQHGGGLGALSPQILEFF